MFAIGLALCATGFFLYVLLGMEMRGINEWRAHLTYGSFCFGVLLILISTIAWLWRVMP